MSEDKDFSSDFDFERANALMDIMAKVANIGPKWMAISAEAGDELEAMNATLVAERAERAKKTRDRNVMSGQPADSGLPQPKNIFPANSGVQEDHDTPRVQRKVT